MPSTSRRASASAGAAVEPSANEWALESPKRTDTESEGVHKWLPYYAGYSEAFVDSVLQHFKLAASAVVLDPMNGSGTTSVVSQRAGHPAIGIELNPAVAAVARAKADVYAHHPGLMDEVSRVVREAESAAAAGSGDKYVEKWFSPATFGVLMRLRSAIDATASEALAPLHDSLSTVLNDRAVGRAQLTTKDFLRAVLVLTARRVSRATDSKNPTWLKASTEPRPDADVLSVFFETANAMLADLRVTFSRASTTQSVAVLSGNARRLPLRSSTVDAIVTSPPYLTRIDYAVGTTPELLLLGYTSEEKMWNLRSSLMGTPCITDAEIGNRPPENWGKACAAVLTAVEQHPSKASATYYLRTYLQYFCDAYEIVRECLRVLKRGAPAVLVVQDSWYKDIHIRLDNIYAEMALNAGATTAETIAGEHVRVHMGLVNTRARKYAKGDTYERVVLLVK